MAAFKLPSRSLKKRRRQLSLSEFRWNSISLKEELGRGTFGTVYLVKCTGGEQYKGEAADAKRRFEKEAAILSFSSPEPTILLACGRNRELWEQPL